MSNSDHDISKSGDDAESPLEISERELMSSEEDSLGPETSAESPQVSQSLSFRSNDSRNASSSAEGEDTTAAVIQAAGVLDGRIRRKEESSNMFRVLGGDTRLIQQKESHGYITVETGSDHSTDRSQVQVHGSADQTLARLQDICPNLSQVNVYLKQEVTNTTFVENPSAVVVVNNTVVNQGVEQEKMSDEDKPPSKVQILRNATLRTIQEWTEGMVNTRAVKTLVDKLSAAPPVFVVKGQPGEGKTTVAMMALKRLYDKGRNVFIINTPEEYMTVKSSKNSVILLNDVLGSSHFHISNLSPWEKVFDDCLALIEHTGQQNTSKPTILLVSRSSVLDSASEHIGRFCSQILREDGMMDLTKDMTYTVEEKKQIWSYHAQREKVQIDEVKVQVVCEMDLLHGFPHCCQLFTRMYPQNPNLDIKLFFTRPLEFLQQKIKSMFHDDVAGPLLRNMSQNDGAYSGGLSNTSENTYQIKQIIANGEGIYFRQEKNRVTFQHPSICDAVALTACENDPSFVIDRCSMEFLNDRLRLKGLSKSHKEEQTVNVDSKFKINIIKRMKAEIETGNIADVLLHPSFHDWDFVKQFMEEMLSCKSDPRSVRRLIQQKDKLTKESFLVLSSKSKSSNILQYICERVTLSQQQQKDLLFSICRYTSTASMHYFLKEYPKCQLSVKDNRGRSLLIAAAQSRCDDLMTLLMSKGVSVQAKDALGCTALYYVCQNGVDNAATVVDMMLKNGADVDDMCSFNTTPLVLACYCGNSSVVEALMKSKIGAILRDKEGTRSIYSDDFKTPLHIAVQSGFETIVQILVSEGAEINARDESGRTPLQVACDKETDTIVEMLLTKGAETNTFDESGSTPLHDACSRGSNTIVEMLLNKGAELNTCDERGRTPLHDACNRGNDIVVKTCLSKGAEVNTCDQSGTTALHDACERSFDTIVEMLLNKGAEVNACDESNSTPLHVACERGSDTIVEMLLNKGAEVNSCDQRGRTPFHVSCKTESVTIVEMLVSKGAEINARDEFCTTPLHDACKRGSASIVEMLLNKEAEVDAYDNRGSTPLHEACKGGSATIVEMLLNKEAEVDACDNSDSTPLHEACKGGSATIVEMLLNKEAEVDAYDNSGSTPLHHACLRESDTIVEILLSKGAEVNTCDEYGSTPLHQACRMNKSDTIVKMLLSKGAEINAVDLCGITPLDSAQWCAGKAVVTTLIERGAERSPDDSPHAYTFNIKHDV